MAGRWETATVLVDSGCDVVVVDTTWLRDRGGQWQESSRVLRTPLDDYARAINRMETEMKNVEKILLGWMTVTTKHWHTILLSHSYLLGSHGYI